MKKLFLVFITVSLVSAALFYVGSASAQAEKEADAAQLPSPHLVISQLQAGGAANANDEFIEIHNNGASPIDLNGYRVVYRSASGTNDVGPMAVWISPTTIQPGQYMLIAATGYDGGVTPDKVYDPTSCSCSMSVANGGGVAIRFGDNNTGTVIDSMAWSPATNAFVEGTVASAITNDNSKIRGQNGCQDTDNNANDFATLSPSAPRNSSSAPVTCSGSGTTLFAAMNANPTTVAPSANTLMTVTVIPATTPPSTFIAVSANLSSIGGASSQQFFDDGTNGDVTPGDNVFTFLATVAPGTPGGAAPIVGAAADLQGRVAVVQVILTINAPAANDDPLIFGNPSNATSDVANENNYLMQKPQYSLSYSRSKATPNWVAWRLDSTWVGTAPRQDDYRPDPAVPAGWYQVLDTDYSGSGYDRGHMCPSGDRTRSIPDNSATFLMTNFVPQLAANNQGPWEDFESYCRTLAAQGNEIYIITGPVGNIGTIALGRIVVPQYTWKVVLVIPNGNNDLARASTRTTRVFGIIVPNFPPVNINAPWRDFRVTVNEVEWLTGYDFFSLIPKNTQEIIERKRDRL